MYKVKNNDSIFGGVLLGLASQLKADVILVRVIFVLLCLSNPIAFGIVYLALWALLPTQNTFLTSPISTSENFKTKDMKNQARSGNIAGGLVLIILGAIFSFRTFFDINLFSYIQNMWPLALIGIGVWIIVKEKDDSNQNKFPNNGGGNYGGGQGTSY